MPSEKLETRSVLAVFEMRDDQTTGAPVLEGYAATFGQPYDLGPFREQIDPAAFNRTLGTKPDVRLLIDHEGQPLARTKSGTLDLSPDSTGLHMRSMLDPSDPDVQRLLPKMRRGDLDQMSFAFRVPAGGDSWTDDMSLRTLRNVDLNGGDVSVVTYPANPATSASLRTRNEMEAACLFLEAFARERRAGKEISAANVEKLTKVLMMLHAADVAVDAAQPILADVLGVPNPDKDGEAPPDEPQANSGRPLDLARRAAAALDL